ncbi:MAG: DUF2889 domain-containing protein [Deltaproteobacteria bacterium]|nr:DUF2889 domain-containing protein [Deltaproteobacteria bacterium]
MSESAATKDDRMHLCTRNKKIDVYFLPSKTKVQAEAEMQDGVHHMKINMILTYPLLRIEEIRCEMPGVPDAICRNARSYLEPLIGKRMVSGFKKVLGNNGSSKDCMLLMDLFDDVCTTVNQGIVVLGKQYLKVQFPGIEDEQIYKIWLALRPDIGNSCLRYADDSPFMKKVAETEWPQGSQEFVSGWKKMLGESQK